MTDQDLKLALAKMLPEKIVLYHNPQFPELATIRWMKDGRELQETEWLHVCWLVEESLDPKQRQDFRETLSDILYDNLRIGAAIHATWQQRAATLIKVKGHK